MRGNRRIDRPESPQPCGRRIGQTVQLGRDQRTTDAPARLGTWSQRQCPRQRRQLVPCVVDCPRRFLRKTGRKVGLHDGKHGSGIVVARGRLELDQGALEPREQDFVVSALAFVQPCWAFVVGHP